MTAGCSPVALRALAQAFLTATQPYPLRRQWGRERGHCTQLLLQLDRPGYLDSADRVWDEAWLLDLWHDLLDRELIIPRLAWHPDCRP